VVVAVALFVVVIVAAFTVVAVAKFTRLAVANCSVGRAASWGAPGRSGIRFGIGRSGNRIPKSQTPTLPTFFASA